MKAGKRKNGGTGQKAYRKDGTDVFRKDKRIREKRRNL